MASPSDREVVLEIDYAALLEEQIASSAENTVLFLREDGTELLGDQHGVRVREPGDPEVPAIIVRLSWIDYMTSRYRIVVATRRPGEEPRLVEEFECKCVGSQLTEAILARLPAALEQIDEEVAAAGEPAEVEAESESAGEPAEVEAESAEAGEVHTEPEKEPEPREPRRQLQPLGKAGIGVGLAGAGMIVAGLVLLPRDLVTSGPAGDVKDYSPHNVGIGLAAGGGLVLAAGISMLTLDLVRGRPSKVAVLPHHGSHHTGVTFTFRF